MIHQKLRLYSLLGLNHATTEWNALGCNPSLFTVSELGMILLLPMLIWIKAQAALDKAAWNVT